MKMPTVTRLYDELLAGNFSPKQYADDDELRFKRGQSLASLHRSLTEVGFKFTTRKTHYVHQNEGPGIVIMRQNYLDWNKQLRDEGYVVCYQDKTWVFKSMAQRKVWPFDGVEQLYKLPPGSDDRAIVYHLRSAATRLLKNCLLL